MTALIRGQRQRLSELTPALTLELEVSVSGPASSYDAALFGLDAAGKLSDERYMVFYNQPRTPEGGAKLLGHSAQGGRFRLDLARLPESVQRVLVAVSTEGQPFSQVGSAALTMTGNGQQAARFEVRGGDFGDERAVILAELYRRDGWRLSAVGQGFAGGLDALVRAYGGEVAAPRPAPGPAPRPAPTPTTPTPPTSTPPVSTVRLSKVTLEKQGQRAPLSLKKGGGLQPVRVNLNWDQLAGGGGEPAPKRGGLLGGLGSVLSGGLGASGRSADLDLGCMYTLQDGSSGVIQALGGRFGSADGPPYILLDKDDRSGQAQDGENLSLLRPETVRRVLVFAYIYQGTGNFSQVGGRMTVKDAQGNEVALRLNNPDPRHTFCAIALFEGDGQSLTVSKEERYFAGHRECDEAYGFGFRWTAGRK